jgi:hypothetical protein
MGALLGARGGVSIPDGERKAVFRHLSRHYEQFGKEPPEFRHVEAQVLRHCPDAYAFLEDSGALVRIEACAVVTTLVADEFACERCGGTTDLIASCAACRSADPVTRVLGLLQARLLDAGVGAAVEQTTLDAVAALLLEVGPVGTKVGRVLARRNEERLRKAHGLVAEVLSELDKQDEDHGPDDCPNPAECPAHGGKQVAVPAPGVPDDVALELEDDPADEFDAADLRAAFADLAHERARQLDTITRRLDALDGVATD